MWGLEAPYNTWLRLVLYGPLDPTLCALLLMQHSCPCFNYYIQVCTSSSSWSLSNGFSITVFLSTTSQWASARNLSLLSSRMAFPLASVMRLIAVTMVKRRALEMSLKPSVSSRYLTVVAFTSRVRTTMPAVWNSTCVCTWTTGSVIVSCN